MTVNLHISVLLVVAPHRPVVDEDDVVVNNERVRVLIDDLSFRCSTIVPDHGSAISPRTLLCLVVLLAHHEVGSHLCLLGSIYLAFIADDE
jgi:hypothetical protein